MDLQLMYCIGSLIAGLTAVVAFIRGVKIMQEMEDANWREEWKEQIETIGRQTQNVSG